MSFSYHKGSPIAHQSPQDEFPAPAVRPVRHSQAVLGRHFPFGPLLGEPHTPAGPLGTAIVSPRSRGPQSHFEDNKISKPGKEKAPQCVICTFASFPFQPSHPELGAPRSQACAQRAHSQRESQEEPPWITPRGSICHQKAACQKSLEGQGAVIHGPDLLSPSFPRAPGNTCQIPASGFKAEPRKQLQARVLLLRCPTPPSPQKLPEVWHPPRPASVEINTTPTLSRRGKPDGGACGAADVRVKLLQHPEPVESCICNRGLGRRGSCQQK